LRANGFPYGLAGYLPYVELREIEVIAAAGKL